MSKKEHDIFGKIATIENIREAADEAIEALDDHQVWFAKKFLARKEAYCQAILRMMLTAHYPLKAYKAVKIQEHKEREIFPMHFYPWSVIFHAIKRVIEPICEQRVFIDDTSAGIHGKGQLYAAKRVEMFIRRYPEYKYYVQTDCRKFYPSIPHKTVENAIRRFTDDERFFEMLRLVMFDYVSNVDNDLEREKDVRKRYIWATTDYADMGPRGVTIGSCISQIIGNICLTSIDEWAKNDKRIKCYHRHCDDTLAFFRTKEECWAYLQELDQKTADLGLVLKHSAVIAPIKDEDTNIGRPIDFCGYIFSRNNMRLRKRTKQTFARAMSRVKSRKRSRELMAAYWGWCKYGNCMNLWRKITNNKTNKKAGNMFKDFNIKDKPHTQDGKKFFDAPYTSIRTLANEKITILDFETDIKVRGKEGRTCILIDHNGVKIKCITSSGNIRDMLTEARRIEQEQNVKIFPQETIIRVKNLSDGKSTYTLE